MRENVRNMGNCMLLLGSWSFLWCCWVVEVGKEGTEREKQEIKTLLCSK